MLTTIEGIYENGVVRLLEPLSGVQRARVVVTLLPESMSRPSPIKTLREMAVAERERYLQEMYARWQGKQSSSEEFALRKQEEIALENRRWEQGE